MGLNLKILCDSFERKVLKFSEFFEILIKKKSVLLIFVILFSDNCILVCAVWNLTVCLVFANFMIFFQVLGWELMKEGDGGNIGRKNIKLSHVNHVSNCTDGPMGFTVAWDG